MGTIAKLMVLVVLSTTAAQSSIRGTSGTVSSGTDPFLILIPKTLRPGLTTTITFNQKSYRTAIILMKLMRSNTVHYTLRKQISGGRESYTFNLTPPTDLAAGTYTLKSEVNIESHNRTSTVYERQATVTVVSKTTSILIQSDKSVYKPSQTVNFRVVVVKPDLKPYSGKCDVFIKDGNKNRIKQWKNVELDRGVATFSFELSDQPVLGSWIISVETDSGQKLDKNFEVDEYVLPKFEVTVELPKYISLHDKKTITAKVEAKYTFGKGVDGFADIRFKNGASWARGVWNSQKRAFDPVPVIERSNVQLNDGKAEIRLTHEQLKFLFNGGEISQGRQLKMEANVTEVLTGTKLSADDESTQFYNHAEKVEIVATPANFKPGFDFTGFVKLSNQDGSLVSNPGTATLKVTYRTKNDVVPVDYNDDYDYWGGRRIRPRPQPVETQHQMAIITLTFGSNGIAKFEFRVPRDAYNKLDLLVKYKENILSVSDSHQAKETNSPTDSFIQITSASSQKIKAGDYAEFDIDTSRSGVTVYYQIVNRGSIEKSQTNALTGTSARLRVRTSSAMAPRSTLLVYYIKSSNNEVVADSISFNVEGIFKHEVSLDFNREEALPSNRIALRVNANPNSFVGVLAVDQSVLLLGTGHDITQDDVSSELDQYSTSSTSSSSSSRRSHLGWCGWWRGCWYPIPVAGDNAKEIIRNSGLVVLTNALVPNTKTHVPQTRRNLSFAWSFGSNGFSAARQSARRGLPGLDQVRSFSSARTQKIQTVGNINNPPTPSAAKPTVRKVFPETWLWTNETTSSRQRSVSISAKVPDTITSWVASAFAINSPDGLGVADETSVLRVFKQFFVSLNLPYSVVRGEEVIVQAIVFNYLPRNVNVNVKLDQSADYSSVSVDAQGRTTSSRAGIVKNILCKAGEGTPVFFPIVPTKLGQIVLRVTAISSAAGDAVERELLVEAEGIEKSYSQTFLIQRNGTRFTLPIDSIVESAIRLKVPNNTVEGSKRIEFTLIGNVLGAALNGLEKLIKMPYGCGEQNMVNLAPTVYVTQYLKLSGILSAEQEQRSKTFMEKGYQRELTYQRSDGSFSVWGDRDASGSMWLTAFVVRTFQTASDLIYIDEDVLVQASNWMIGKQSADGSFPEPGNVWHKALMGGAVTEATKKYTMTAYVLTALVELKKNPALTNHDAISTATQKAKSFLEDYVDSNSDFSDKLYAAGIMSYALQISGSSRANAIFNKLNQYAVTESASEGGFKYWKLNRGVTKTLRSQSWEPINSNRESSAIEIELAAYAMLTYAARGDLSGGIPILQWIVRQRNENGGFKSTQDTVVGLQALSSLAMRVSGSADLTVTLDLNYPTESSDRVPQTYRINRNNQLVLQMRTLNPAVTNARLFATGNGIAVASFTVTYNEMEFEQEPVFETTAAVVSSDKNKLQLRVCTKWLLEDTTGMAILEVGIPSGFTADVEALKKANIDGVKKIESLNRKVVFYLDEISSEQQCIDITAQRTGLVAKSQPVAVQAYDYYEPEKQQTIFYSSDLLKNTNVCDLCGDKCQECDGYRNRK